MITEDEEYLYTECPFCHKQTMALHKGVGRYEGPSNWACHPCCNVYVFNKTPPVINMTSLSWVQIQRIEAEQKGEIFVDYERRRE